MRVHLHGKLQEEFSHLDGIDWKVDSFAEAVKLINVNSGDNRFCRTIRPMRFEILRENLDGEPLDERSLRWNISSRDIHMVPVAAGSGRTAMIIIGTIIVATAAVAMIVASGGLATPMVWGAVTAGEMLLLGGTLILGGILSPAASDYEARDDNIRSPLYQGGLNRAAQGAPVPLALGRKIRAGGVIISTGLDIVQELYIPPGSDVVVV